MGNRKALVSVTLLDQHRAVQGVVEPKFDLETKLDSRRREGPDELIFESRKKKGAATFVECSPPLVDSD